MTHKFQPGNTYGKGRPKGSKNKNTLNMEAIFEEFNFDPLRELLQLYRETKDPAIKKEIAFKLMEFGYAKRKAIDMKVEGQINQSIEEWIKANPKKPNG